METLPPSDPEPTPPLHLRHLRGQPLQDTLPVTGAGATELEDQEHTRTRATGGYLTRLQSLPDNRWSRLGRVGTNGQITEIFDTQTPEDHDNVVEIPLRREPDDQIA